jgi:peroxiredoxin
MLRWIAASLAGFGLGCFIYSCSPSKPVKAAVKPGTERHAAPDFALKDADGKTVHLSDYKGKVVLLDFWATWCGPCKIEIPWFMDFERQHKHEGFSVLGVSMDEDGWQAVKPFINDLGINYRIVMGNDSIADQYGGVEALPTTFLIDRQGKIAAVHVGLTSKSEIEHGIEQLLQAPKHAAGDLRRVPVSARVTGPK